MSITTNLSELISQLPSQVTLVAVSKTKPVADLMEAYESGQRIFGENKIQEMAGKQKEMPKDIQWHMIGNVQRNKIKYIASFVELIHGVDSLKYCSGTEFSGISSIFYVSKNPKKVRRPDRSIVSRLELKTQHQTQDNSLDWLL